jgi:hypothetical protein
MTRSRTGAVAMLIAAFAFGGLVGGAATTMADRRTHKTRGDRPPQRPSYVDRLGTDLGLSEPQKDSVRAILERHQPAMDSLWETIRPLMQSERQAIRNQIAAMLTPEQQAKYVELQRQDSLRRAEAERNRNGRRQ